MTNTDISQLLIGASALVPSALLIAAGLVPSKTANATGRSFARFGSTVASAAFAAALLAMVGCIMAGPVHHVFFSVGIASFSVHVDTLTVLMLTLVAFLGVVVTRYSINYLDGDPNQGGFVKWLCATTGSVLLLVVSGNLALFAAAWIATSLSLHQLLTFYGDRPAAVSAAWKKFLISRMGDACLIGVLILTAQKFGTWEFTELFAQSSALTPETTGGIGSIAVLLVACAMLKSAQFPFHSWLPETMESPTPVSALMHAGIINAGGFLIVRLSPIISQSPAALNVLALVGAFTALFASVVMMTQTSIKRSLAWSTVSQMGFMMLQCGLGAFSLAVLHIIAHSLYKAHAFLSSGNVVSMAQAAWRPSGKPAAHPVLLVAILALSGGFSWLVGSLFGVTWAADAGVLVLATLFVMAQAFLLWNLWGTKFPRRLAIIGVLMAGATATLWFALHAGAESLLGSVLPHYTPVRHAFEYGVMGLVVLLFMSVLVLQAQLPIWAEKPGFRALYVHASNGFYVGAIAQRIAQALKLPKATA